MKITSKHILGFSKNLLLLAIILMFSFPVFSQHKNHTDSLLAKDWTATFIEENDEKVSLEGMEENIIMKFNLDHTFQIMGDEMDEETGIWFLDKTGKVVTLTNKEGKDKIEMTIIKLTNEELIIENTEIEDGKKYIYKMYLVPMKK